MGGQGANESDGRWVRFAADCNVGRLARWLRALGFDATYEAGIADRDLVALALAEGRVLLTRDADLMRRRAIALGSVRAVLLRDDRADEQLRQVIDELGLSPAGVAGLLGRALSRCLRCNVELVPRTRTVVRDRLPPRVLSTQERFSQCPRCARVYWPGGHWRRLRDQMGVSAP
jgi:uncharacterized protein with PIN domain